MAFNTEDKMSDLFSAYYDVERTYNGNSQEINKLGGNKIPIGNLMKDINNQMNNFSSLDDKNDVRNKISYSNLVHPILMIIDVVSKHNLNNSDSKLNSFETKMRELFLNLYSLSEVVNHPNLQRMDEQYKTNY